MAIAIVERFKQYRANYVWTVGQDKKSDCCKEVAVSRGMTVDMSMVFF